MTSSARHIIGAIAGVVATPLLIMGITEAAANHLMATARFDLAGSTLLWLLLVIGIGMLLGAAAASRVSPLAALIPGVLLLALSVSLSASIDSAGAISGVYGGPNILTAGPMLGMAGGVLLASALFPARWRAAAPTAAPGPYAPYGGTAPGYDQGRAQYGGPGAGYEHGSAQYGGPGSGYDQGPPQYGDPAAGYDQGAPPPYYGGSDSGGYPGAPR